MANPPIAEHVQGLNLGHELILYEFDLRDYNLDYLRFYHGDVGSKTVSFGGLPYTPWPMDVDGFKRAMDGPLPRPTMQFANTDKFFSGLVRGADNFKYSPVRRIRTYERYLDFLEDGVTANPNANGNQHKPIDYLEVNRVPFEGKVEGVEVLQFELRSPIDRPNAKLPNLLLIREHCQQKYRIFDPLTGEFDYSRATCPYAGTDYFDANDESATKSTDRCAQFLTSCKLRYGENAELPFLAFPQIERARAK